MAGYYASEYPEKIKSLVLMDTAGIISPIHSEAWRLYAEKGRNIFLYKTAKEVEKLTAFLFFRPPPIPPNFSRFFASEGVLDYKRRKKLMGDMLKGGADLLAKRLRRIEAETLVFWGADDRIMHPSSIEVLEKGIKNCRVAVFEECGHLPFIEKAMETQQVYKDFLDQLVQKGIHRSC